MERTEQRRPARRRRQQPDINQILFIVVCALALILAVVIVIAVVVRNQPPADQGGSQPTENSQYVGLTISADIENNAVTVLRTITFTGTSDPTAALTVGGHTVPRQPDGSFSYTADLVTGKNEFVFSHKEETYTHTVENRYAVQQYSPSEPTEYNCGATVQLKLIVRNGSTMKVTFNGKTIEMAKHMDQTGIGVAEGFTLYTGSYKLPTGNISDLDLGEIQYSVTCNGITETYTSGKIICKKSADVLASNPAVTPDYGEYIDVGSGYIVEIISVTAETFDGKTTDDKSNPLRNYLPKGTVDYGSTELVYNGSTTYRLLRCGRRVYTDLKNRPLGTKFKVVDSYIGTLPDHNEIALKSLAVDGHFTILTLDTLWKAPFYFDIAPQTYTNPADRNFSISEFTAEYVDITFCYATQFTGNLELADNPLFKSAELITRDDDCTLRLYLKEKGAFYGWDAYYNDLGQLCFRFMNPISVSASDNFYGADLTGLRVMIDVGHGGFDPGAVGKDVDGNQVLESERNLALALILKQELESAGATVIMNRDTDIRLTLTERLTFLKDQAPDMCICIHQNSLDAQYSYYNGCEVSYFTPQSMELAKYIEEFTDASGAYNDSKLLFFYAYFVTRMSNCPLVLMENGYISNPEEATKMLDPDIMLAKAQAMVKGIAKYYLEMSN